MGLLFYAKQPDTGIGGIDGNTVLMMHMDGDQSDSQHTVTHIGDPQFSTAESQFGGSSMYFDGSDYLSIPDSVDFNFGSDDWTVDFWYKFDSGYTLDSFLWTDVSAATGTDGEVYLLHQYGNERWLIGNGANVTVMATASHIRDDVWHHVAFVRSGSGLIIFIDGISSGTGTAFTFGTSAHHYNIASSYDFSGKFKGHIDEFRISNVARWTTDFDVPEGPYTI
jgi:hypothetical protein